MAGKFIASLSFVTPQYVMITIKDLQFRFRKEEDKRRKIEIRIKKIRKKYKTKEFTRKSKKRKKDKPQTKANQSDKTVKNWPDALRF